MNDIQTTEQLGQTLRTARKRLRLTQPQLALAAGVGVRFIVELEAGKPTVRFQSALKVIDALGGVLVLNGLTADRDTDLSLGSGNMKKARAHDQ